MMVTRKATGFSLVLFAILLTGFAPRTSGAPSDDHWLENRFSGVAETQFSQRSITDIQNVPFTVSIENWRFHFCAGVIISENYALTAAQCIDTRRAGALWGKRIRAGSASQIPILGWGGSIHQIEKTIVHPQFGLRTFDYDVGIVKVYTKFVYSSRVQAIPVPVQSEDAFIEYGQSASSYGWGVNMPKGWFSSWWLQGGVSQIVPKQKCAALHTEGQVSERMLCAGDTLTGGPCFGDIGGPLVHKKQLIGLVSWGVRCNDKRRPTVYTNLLDWEIRGFIKSYTDI